MRQLSTLCLLTLILAGSALSQPTIFLKNRNIDTRGGMDSQGQSRLLRRTADGNGRRHWIVQFKQLPGDAEANSLRDLGITVLGYAHENGLVISLETPSLLDGLDLQWAGPFEAADKFSALLPDDPSSMLVEIFSDVSADDIRAGALNLGIQLQDSPDTAPNHLLIRATKDQAQALAEFDGVAYIFPASPELIAGQPVVACVGALTSHGPIGQSVAKASEGWDGPGLGSAALTYSWGAMTGQLPVTAAQTEIVRAFGEWAKSVRVSFAQTTNNSAARNINVLFGRRDHGDPYAFDGPGGVLAHTFYPSAPNPEPLAGDMHFDDDESWHIGPDMDLFSVALHETGHALGLGHSDKPGAVMYPYYQRAAVLTAEDIGAIQSLYASQTANPAPPSVPAGTAISLNVTSPPTSTSASTITISGRASGGNGALTIRCTSNRGYSTTAQGAPNWTLTAQLGIGGNEFAITATDSQGNSASKTVNVVRVAAGLSLQLTAPTTATSLTSTASTIALRGTASHSSGIARIQWINAGGGSGTATGTTNWSTSDIALSDGLNPITINATALDGSTATLAVQVNYARTTATTTRDTTAPALAITTPSTPVFATNAATLVLQGSASDNVGVTSIDWLTSFGGSGRATGTASWTTAPIPLYVGFNAIVVRAFDAAGNMSWRVVQVTRR